MMSAEQIEENEIRNKGKCLEIETKAERIIMALSINPLINSRAEYKSDNIIGKGCLPLQKSFFVVLFVFNSAFSNYGQIEFIRLLVKLEGEDIS